MRVKSTNGGYKLLLELLASGYQNLADDVISLKKISGVHPDFYQLTAELLGEVLNKSVWILVPNDDNASRTEASQLLLNVGGKFVLDDFVKLGYQRVERVWNEGEISILGDVVVIWPFNSDNLIRLSILGENIESMDIIEVLSRKKIGELKTKVFSDNSSSIVIGNDKCSDFIRIYATEDEEEISNSVNLNIEKIPGAENYSSPKNIWRIVENYKTRGYRIIYFTNDADNYEYDLTEHEKSCIDQVILRKGSEQQSIKEGFLSGISKIVVLTDKEAVGEIDLSDFEDVKNKMDLSTAEILKKIVPGDYVVHKDHGIGKYVGIKERDSKYYLEIAYAGEDRLFVPPSASGKITKYIGAGRGKPILTGLNSGLWKRISKRAKERAEEVAKELLQLYALRETQKIEPIIKSEDDIEELNLFIKQFKFEDTDDQILATSHIVSDFQKKKPMDRLLVGDVGYGKTEIAMRAIFAVVNAGYQAVLLAPTTILTQQHYRTLQDRFKNYPVRISCLSRFISSNDRMQILNDLRDGKIDIVVGTHSLLEDSVQFKNLGLLVVDEEQKFGVKQKEKIKSKRVTCNVLSLTATPIPRTLNMALLGIRDISVLATPPLGRLEIINKFEKFNWESVKNAIEFELKRNGQVYFLHNRIGTIEYVYNELTKMFPHHRIGIAHGQMSVQNLSSVMTQFINRNIDILLCTTIIENGLDIPNVNTLVIDDMTMLGLSQAYQIRGRIGRSKVQAYAYFYYEKLRGNAKLRLEAIRNSQELGSGFLLSNKDLEIRGAGDILGKNQSGAINSVGYGLYSEMLNEAVSSLKPMSK